MCKGPEAGPCLACLRNSRRSGWRSWGDEVGVVWDSCMVSTVGLILGGVEGFQQGCGMVSLMIWKLYCTGVFPRSQQPPPASGLDTHPGGRTIPSPRQADPQTLRVGCCVTQGYFHPFWVSASMSAVSELTTPDEEFGSLFMTRA